MKQRLMEVVDAILRCIEERPEIPATESGLRSWLSGQGYSKRDIDAALKMVSRRVFATGPATRQTDVTSLRALSPGEALKLDAEARDALARLELFDLIDPLEREMLLEHARQYEGVVGLDELDFLLSALVCSSRDVESQQTIYSVLDGMNGTLH
jgi:uncharacterized protein Smg (DUF494 family)